MRSSQHNKFYHVVLTDVHRQAKAMHVTVENMNFLKQGLKKLDENYPTENGKHLSSAKISDKELMLHLEFIVKYLGQFGITPHFVEAEWDRIMKEIR